MSFPGSLDLKIQQKTYGNGVWMGTLSVYNHSPPGFGARSNNRTLKPVSINSEACCNPAGPAPITATRSIFRSN